MKLKSSQYPDIYNEANAKKVKTLFDFDNIFTGPVNGFKDAEDYYKNCSSKQFIPKLKLPTLIINALDDPFLPDSCYPYKEVNENSNVNLFTPKYGGHVGFVIAGKPYYWSEKTILAYINTTKV